MARSKRDQERMDPMERLEAIEAEVARNRPKTEQQTLEERILTELSKLGGKRVSDDAILRHGTQLVLPATMTPGDAIDYLRDHIEAMDTVTTFNRTFQFRPNDGAAAFERALKRVFGSADIAKPTWTFFGRQPPELKTIAVGPNGETMQVPQGRISVPSIEGIVVVGHVNSRAFGPLFYLQIDCPRKFKAEVEGLFQVVEDELKKHSIYRGQAVDGNVEPGYLDLSGVDPSQVIYSDDVITQLEANIWSPLRHTNVYRELGIPRKRAVLLEGTYGTGKTLAAYLTAQVAVASGWTFIYCRPNKDDLMAVMGVAKLYQPALVFFEDVDTIAAPTDGGTDHVTQLLDMFDGIQAKGTEIMAVLTTNHKERIHRGMVRPGRLDAMIHIGSLDRGGIERMIRATIQPHLLNDNIDYDAVYVAMEGYLPAFVREASDRAVRYAVSRNEGVPRVLETEDFVDAAVGLRPQFDLMQGAKEGEKADTLGQAMRRVMTPAISAVITDTPIADLEGDHVFTLAPNGD